MSDDQDDAARQEALRRSVVVDMGVPQASESSVAATAEAATESNATVVSVAAAGMAVPASTANPTVERFVSIDHTSPANKKGVEVLEKLADAVRGSNDLFADADERLAVSTEVQGLRAIMSGTKVRVAAVLSAIKDNGVIAFLAKEGANAAIRYLAQKALEWLWTLIP